MLAITEIDAHEAKTHLAELVPTGRAEHRQPAQAAGPMRQFMQAGQPLSGTELKALIEEGRD